MENTEIYFEDLRQIASEARPLTERYESLYALLQRICIARSANFDTDYSSIYSRLFAVCRHLGVNHRLIDGVRRRARRVVMNLDEPREEQLRLDINTLAQFIAQGEEEVEVPREFAGPISVPPTPRAEIVSTSKRGIVTAVSGNTVSLTTSSGDVAVDLSHMPGTLRGLCEGMAVNLVDLMRRSDGSATVRYLIVEPDYLVDVSALTASFKRWGAHPANYLLGMLAPRRTSLAILLGEAANQFVDDLVNSSVDLASPQALEALYRESLRRHFAEYMLAYATSDEPVDVAYFDRLHATFINIAETVRTKFASIGLEHDAILLEPAFVCPTLGLRGRFDIMSLDNRVVVELKSGRANEPFPPGSRPILPDHAHVLQMSLYKEILHYNLSLQRSDVSTHLLYSRYPRLFDERISIEAITEALDLRGQIVLLETAMRDGHTHEVLRLLSPETLNTAQLHDRFWERYLLPQILEVSQPIAQMTPLEQSYITHFLTFLEREKFISKTSDSRPDSLRGLASAWNTPFATKLAAGDILPGLTILETEGTDGIESIRFSLPKRGDDFMPNFTVGEMVQLYECNTAADTMLTRQLVRSYVSYIDATTLHLRLAYRQRNARFFPRSSTYAIEHDGTDGPTTTAMRGLFSLLSATPERRALILGQRPARLLEHPLPLLGKYAPATAAIVSAAFSVADYYLLVGPPGTGKTSVALRSMVEEFLLSRQASISEQTATPIGALEGLLLMAYTNRAVDEICDMLNSINAPFVRIGSEHSCAEAHRSHILKTAFSDATNRSLVLKRLGETPIVVGTVATLSNHTELFTLRPYLAIVDEASQVLEPQLLGLLSAVRPNGTDGISRFILIGDHKQLPAVVQLPASQTIVRDPLLRAIGLTDLRQSLFQRLHALALRPEVPGGIVGMLDHQGRMHTAICSFVNQHFYEGRLQPVPLPHQEEQLRLPEAQSAETDAWRRFVGTSRVGFVNVVPQEGTQPNPKANAAEAAVVAQIVETISQLGPERDPAFSIARHVGIIVPFRNQIATIRAALRARGIASPEHITIDTVECFQGSQRDYIVYSTTVGRAYQVDFLSEVVNIGESLVDRKLNVAITRARRQFFLVGNAALLRRSPVYAALIEASDVFQQR